MSKTLKKCIVYSVKELESYAANEGSCVQKINHKMHLALGPFALRDIKKSVKDRLEKKVGVYDIKLDGILLAVKHIKILSSTAALRADDPLMHFDITAVCYVFKPTIGAIVDGTVRHVGIKHIGVLIYRVFSVKIQLENKIDPDTIQIDEIINFRIKNFNFSNLFPYIEGEILDSHVEMRNKVNRKLGFEEDSPDDSGIEERESSQSNDLVDTIKKEPLSEPEAQSPLDPKKKTTKARKRKADSATESEKTPAKKVAKTPKKAKTPTNSSSSSSNTNAAKESIKKELDFTNSSSTAENADDSSFAKPKQVKAKKQKANTSIDTSDIDLEKVKSEPPSESETPSPSKTKKKTTKVKKVKKEEPQDDEDDISS